MFAYDFLRGILSDANTHFKPMMCFLRGILVFICLNISILTSKRVGTNESYSVGLANRMCEFALASYCCGNLGHGVADWSCDACKKQPEVTNVTVFSSKLDKDANGFVAYEPVTPSIIIAFAGTDPLSIIDWLDDIDTIKVKYPAPDCNCSVHQGFYDTYKAVSGDVWAAVDKYQIAFGKDTNIQITGHSLGAALAVHAALDGYLNYDVQPQFVYDFGQPRVGDYNFEMYYHNRINQHYRVTHRKDPVPHLPAEAFGFHHMALEIFYKSHPNGTYQVCDGSGEDPNCSDQYLADLDINDHLDYMGFSFDDNYLSCKL